MDVPGCRPCCTPCCDNGANDVCDGINSIATGIGKGLCCGMGVLTNAGNALGCMLCDLLKPAPCPPPRPCCCRPKPHPPTCTCTCTCTCRHQCR